MEIEFFFKNIPEFLTAYTELEETVKVMQVLVANRSRAFIEPFHCFSIRFFRQFGHLLFVELAQHHILLCLWQLVDGKE